VRSPGFVTSPRPIEVGEHFVDCPFGHVGEHASASGSEDADEEQEYEADDDDADDEHSEEAGTRSRLKVVVSFAPVPQVRIVRVRRGRAYWGGHRSSLSSTTGPTPLAIGNPYPHPGRRPV